MEPEPFKPFNTTKHLLDIFEKHLEIFTKCILYYVKTL